MPPPDASREPQPSPPAGDAVPTPPTPRMLSLMVLIGLACLGLAGVLGYAHVAAWWAQTRTTAPFCGAIDWLGCDSVLNSRFAYWMGIPVVWPALASYSLVVLGLMLVKSPAMARCHARGIRLVLCAVAWAILGSAAWFTWVQVVELGTLCLYCTIEHVLGTALAVMILLSLRPGRAAPFAVAVALGLGGAAALAAGQLLNEPDYAQPVAWQVGEGGQWTESAPPDRALRLLNGKVVINPDAHPIIGNAQAERLIVEVADFSCTRCAKLDAMLTTLAPRLGDHLATLIVFFPLDAGCNPIMTQTPEGYEESCELARLAAAVWLADPDSYALFHHWLFEHQQTMTAARAHDKAQQLIGASRLDELLAGDLVEQIIQRDIELARALMTTPDDPSMGAMPGLIIGNHRIEVLPDRAETLWHVLRVFSTPGRGPHPAGNPSEPEN